MDISKKINQKLDFSSSTFRQIMNQLAIIDSFKGTWEVIDLRHSKHLKELQKIATIESIGSSTRIEGATLTDDEVAKLLKSVKVKKLTTREEQEVVGYYEGLKTILDHYDEIDLTERYIHQLHSILLKHSAKDQSHRGRYKSVSNHVVANYPDGTQRIIFRTTEPAMTGKEMEELLLWFTNRQREKDLHPVLVTAAFIYEFLSIHPYQDGNGRLSRLMTTLILIKQGYDFTQYISFEHIIEERKSDYYQALRDGQKDRYTEHERMDQWILLFLDCLVILIERLKVKYEQYSKLSKELNDRQLSVLELIKKQRKIKIGELQKAFKDISRSTLKSDLAYLVNEGFLIKIGELKGTIYHYKE